MDRLLDRNDCVLALIDIQEKLLSVMHGKEALLENAVKYTPAGTPIEISASVHDGAIAVDVADRGPGFPPGEEGRVFEKFYRVPGAAGAGGVGLGLTICRGIVTAHGGRIRAENRAGGGAVFHFTLPLVGTPPSGVPVESDDG